MEEFLPESSQFNISGKPAFLNGKNRTALDFWKWGYSDLMQNITRGYVAQYIVAWALGIDNKPNQPWQPFDLLDREGRKIEVKSTSKVQAWESDGTVPKFVIGPTLNWTEQGRSKEATWNADIYVLCYFQGELRDPRTIMDLDLWKFWVFQKDEIMKVMNGISSIGVSALEKQGQKSITAFGLQEAIRS